MGYQVLILKVLGRSFGSVDVSIVDTVQVVLNEVKWFLLFIFLTVFSYGLAFGAMFRTAVDEAVEEEESIVSLLIPYTSSY